VAWPIKASPLSLGRVLSGTATPGCTENIPILSCKSCATRLPSFPPSLALLSKKEGSGMAKRMKRKPSEDKAPSSATPGQEPPPAEMGNQHAQGQWWDPVPQAPVGSEREARTDPAAMSEEELEALSPTEAESGGTVKLTHPIPLPPGVLSQKAMQLKALERYKGFIEDLFPRVYQLLCNEQKFLRGTEPRELAFIETHGRRWRAGEGFLVGAEGLPPVPELKFDPSPAKLVASCKMLRSQCDGIKLSRRNKTLAEHVKDVTRPFTAHRNAVRSGSRRGS
jgi:hypothetical protein